MIETQNTIPHSIEAEVCVLGSILLDRSCIGKVKEILSFDDFYRPPHCSLYSVLLSMAGDEIDLVLVRDRLINDGLLEHVGGVEYLMELVDGVPSSTNVEYYAEIVREKAILRDIIKTSQQAISRAYSNDNAQEIADESIRLVHTSSHRLANNTMQAECVIGDAAVKSIEVIEDRILNPGIAGIQTGLPSVDAVTHGLRKGFLTTLGADPGGFKSTVALSMAMSAAHAGWKGAFITAEMNAVEQANRVLQARAAVWGTRLLNGEISHAQKERLDQARDEVRNDKLWIVPKSCSIDDIRMIVTDRLVAWGGLDFIVVDYVHIMKIGTDKRNEDLDTFLRELKILAADFDIAVLALSQFNRETTKLNTPPAITSFLGSSAFEQHSNQCLLLWSDPTEPMQGNNVDGLMAKYRILHIKVVKNRDGATTKWAINGEDGLWLKVYPFFTRVDDPLAEVPIIMGSV